MAANLGAVGRRRSPPGPGGGAPSAPSGPAWRAALIQTRLVAPGAPRGQVVREALLERLDARRRAAPGRLTVVAAPAGFGKTTLLGQWHDRLGAAGIAVGWLGLDEDDDPHQLGAYLVAAIGEAPRPALGHAAALLADDPLTPMKTVQAALLNELATRADPVYLFLDEFERLPIGEATAMIWRLLRYAPPNLHVVVGSRQAPELAISSLALRDEVCHLGADDLRFTAADARAFFAAAPTGSAPPIDHHGIELLTDATEGWVAGLRLAALSLRDRADAPRLARDLAGHQAGQRAGPDAGIDAWLQDTVLAELPDDLLPFMLRVSILDRLGAGVCDAIVGDDLDGDDHDGEPPGDDGRLATAGPVGRSWARLDWLERHNVFLRPLDGEGCWFRFHALMAETLRRRAARQFGNHLAVLHRRAARWFADAGLWPEAVRHALAGGETDRAAEWVEHAAAAMIDRGDAPTLLGWLARLPPTLIRGRPRLRSIEAWALTLAFRIREARVRLGRPESDEADLDATRALIAGFADEPGPARDFGGRPGVAGLPAASWTRGFADAARIYGLAYGGDPAAAAAEIARGRRAILEGPDALGASASASAGDGDGDGDGRVAGDSDGIGTGTGTGTGPGTGTGVSTGNLGRADPAAAPLYAGVLRDCMVGLALLVGGRLAEATTLFETILARAEGAAGRDSAAAALPAGYLLALHYEGNALARAEAVMTGRTTIAMQACPLGSLLRFCRGAARLHARAGDIDSSLVILEEARELAIERDWLRLRAACDAETVRLCLMAGKGDEAARIVDALGVLMPPTWHRGDDGGGSFIETWTSWSELRARFALAHGRAAEAVVIIEGLRAELAPTGYGYLKARAALLLALALGGAGAPPRTEAAAFAVLDEALGYANREPMVNSFIDGGRAAQRLLERRRQQLGHAPRGDGAMIAARVDGLLAAFGPAAPLAATATAPTGPSPLSSRELEILDEVARGLSNKEVARVLGVAPETIKWHLKKIFEKLAVGSRIEAVQIAASLRRGRPRS